MKDNDRAEIKRVRGWGGGVQHFDGAFVPFILHQSVAFPSWAWRRALLTVVSLAQPYLIFCIYIHI